MRAAVLWPAPRGQRWAARAKGEDVPDQTDGLAGLAEYGVQLHLEDSVGFPLNPLGRMSTLYAGLDPLRALRLVSRRRRYDTIVAVGCSAGAIPLMLAPWLRMPPVVVVDPALSEDYRRRRQLQDLTLPSAAVVVVYGRNQLFELGRRYPRLRVEFVHHRVDSSFYCASDRSGRRSPMTLLAVGNDVSRDYALLNEATSAVLGTGVGLRCLVRTDRDISDYRSLIRVPPASFPALRELYRSADIFVMPAKNTMHAGGINALLEAMSCGLPVICTSSSGLGDYAKGDRARVVPVGDAVALANAIVALVGDHEARLSVGRAARAFVEEHCSLPRYSSRLASILASVA